MLGRIAIHLSDDHDCARRIEAGLMLAGQHGAEAVGLYAPGGNLGRMYEENLLPPEASQILHQRYQADHDRVRALFLDRAAAVGAAAQWRALRGQTDVALSLHVRYCDLLVMSKSASTDRMSSLVSNLPEAVMMAAGRPVLMIPNHGTFDSIGQRILYCWDQRREAARAFADAAPLLRQCQSLAVLEIDRDTEMLKEQGLTPDDFDHYCVSLGYPGPQHLLKRQRRLRGGQHHPQHRRRSGQRPDRHGRLRPQPHAAVDHGRRLAHAAVHHDGAGAAVQLRHRPS